MKYIKNLGFKLIISTKRLKKRLISIVTDVFAVVGVLLMIAEAAAEIYDYQGIFEFYRKNIWWISGAIVVGCIWKNWDRLTKKVNIKDSPDVSITIKVCNALANEGALIIPTNTTFDTVMDDSFISVESVQGQYQNKYFKGDKGKEELDRLISTGLKDKNSKKLKDGRKTKIDRYPIGTVCRISKKDKRAYFLADSDINKNGIPLDSDIEDVSNALVCLWNTLTDIGNTEPYSIPLLGTGRARVKDASRDDVVQQIILSFLAATKDHKITESLTVCIHPKDFENVDWDGLCEFLEYQSRYSNIRPVDRNPGGIPEKTPDIVMYKGEYEITDSDESDLSSTEARGQNLTEREQIMVSLLTGNKMDRRELSAAMGLSMASTNSMLKKLIQAQIVDVKGTEARQLFFVPEQRNGGQPQ